MIETGPDATDFELTRVWPCARRELAWRFKGQWIAAVAEPFTDLIERAYNDSGRSLQVPTEGALTPFTELAWSGAIRHLFPRIHVAPNPPGEWPERGLKDFAE
jgi:hypothetical protein